MGTCIEVDAPSWNNGAGRLGVRIPLAADAVDIAAMDDIANWWRAADTQTSGGMAAVPNRLGGIELVAPDAARSPFATQVNGVSGRLFGGAHRLQCSGAVINAGPQTWITVLRPSSGFGTAFLLGGFGGVAPNLGIYMWVDGAVRYQMRQTEQLSSAAGKLVAGETVIAAVSWDGATFQASFDGVLDDLDTPTTSGGPNVPPTFYLGGHDAGLYCKMTWFETLHFAADMHTAVRRDEFDALIASLKASYEIA